MNGIRTIWNSLNPKGVQLFITSLIAVWGGWVFIPAWNVFDTSLTYKAMQVVGSESGWGFAMIVLALMSFYALDTDAPGAMLVMSFVTSSLMTFVSFLFAISAPQSVGWVLWFCMASFNWKAWHLLLKQPRPPRSTP